MDFEYLIETLPRLWDGLVLTLEIVPLSLAIGFALAWGVALMRLSANPLLAGIAYGYVYVFRSTPLLVQIFLIYYGSGQFHGFFQDIGLWGVLREAYWCAIIALTMNTTAYTSEIIRGGIQSVPWGQIEAARACGMSRSLLFRRITVPVAIRQALPAYGNEMILIVKSSSLASTITIMELTGVARQAIAETFLTMQIFALAGAIYLALNFALTRLVQALERKLSPDLYRPREAVPELAR